MKAPYSLIILTVWLICVSIYVAFGQRTSTRTSRQQFRNGPVRRQTQARRTGSSNRLSVNFRSQVGNWPQRNFPVEEEMIEFEDPSFGLDEFLDNMFSDSFTESNDMSFDRNYMQIRTGSGNIAIGMNGQIDLSDIAHNAKIEEDLLFGDDFDDWNHESQMTFSSPIVNIQTRANNLQSQVRMRMQQVRSRVRSDTKNQQPIRTTQINGRDNNIVAFPFQEAPSRQGSGVSENRRRDNRIPNFSLLGVNAEQNPENRSEGRFRASRRQQVTRNANNNVFRSEFVFTSPNTNPPVTQPNDVSDLRQNWNSVPTESRGNHIHPPTISVPTNTRDTKQVLNGNNLRNSILNTNGLSDLTLNTRQLSDAIQELIKGVIKKRERNEQIQNSQSPNLISNSNRAGARPGNARHDPFAPVQNEMFQIERSNRVQEPFANQRHFNLNNNPDSFTTNQQGQQRAPLRNGNHPETLNHIQFPRQQEFREQPIHDNNQRHHWQQMPSNHQQIGGPPSHTGDRHRNNIHWSQQEPQHHRSPSFDMNNEMFWGQQAHPNEQPNHHDAFRQTFPDRHQTPESQNFQHHQDVSWGQRTSNNQNQNGRQIFENRSFDPSFSPQAFRSNPNTQIEAEHPSWIRRPSFSQANARETFSRG